MIQIVTERTWFVAHGPDTVHFVEVPAGGEFMSGQPNIEEFSTETEARARAIELGWVDQEGGE